MLKPNGVLAVGAFDDLGVETPVSLPSKQRDKMVAAQNRFCEVSLSSEQWDKMVVNEQKDKMVVSEQGDKMGVCEQRDKMVVSGH